MSPAILEPKPGVNMGRVLVPITVQNTDDLDRLRRGEITAESVRTIRTEALVDTDATFLCLPVALIQQLGLTFDRKRESRTVSGLMTMDVYRNARLDVQGRDCSVEVMALPHSSQTLLGQIPLETLDYWVDITIHRLVGNPEHGGHWMAEVF
jgi:predicted aspartyl protease